MISTMVNQLTKNATIEELKEAGLDTNYAGNNKGLQPVNANGINFTTAYISVTGHPLADLQEDMAAEEKAKVVYENLMDLTKDPDLLAPLSFLRQREVVHFNRFKALYDEYKKLGY